jgi:tRNA threonylcarbamoyladenosine biosynthesis protein TsaE
MPKFHGIEHNSLVLSLVNLEQTNTVGFCLGQILSPGSILMLEGDLGSGKTALVQSMGQCLGIIDAIASPTFALIHEYSEGRIPLYHLDLYRLSPPEVTELHLETYWEGIEIPLGIVAIEWPERLAPWPEDYLHLVLTYTEPGRQLNITPHGKVNWNAIQPKIQQLGLQL